MRNTKLMISLPEPCTENWAEMTPCEKGRFCASCQKQVIDFTTLTDTEVMSVLKTIKDGRGCGRFHVSQIGREFYEAKQAHSFPNIFLKRVAASLLFFQTLVTTAWAQTPKQKTTQHAQNITGKKINGAGTVTGRVMDYATNEPLYGMTVQIVGTEIKVMTDKLGYFKITLPDSFKVTKFTLQARYADKSAKCLAGTVINTEEVDTHDLLSGKRIILYRYPDEVLSPVTITSSLPSELIYIRQGGFSGESIGGARTSGIQYIIDGVDTTPVTKTFWQKITSPFRKKDKSQ